jgi:glycosyltransferase involved in cell wall biosynthesis
VRITFVLPFVNLTGGIRMLLQYANALHDERHDVTVVYPCWPYRFHHTRSTQLREWRKQWRTPVGVDWIDVRCRVRRVPIVANAWVPEADIVIATAWPTAYDVARLDPSRGQKLHLVFHHESGTGAEPRVRGVSSLPLVRVTVSENVRAQLTNQFHCAIAAVVPNGVDTRTFFPDGRSDPRSVLMLYHNDPRKGAADGFEALRRVRERIPDVRIRVCGTVRPNALPAWADFVFHPPDAALRRMYSTSTVLLYPSREEGFGLPPLEAMACGCAVVTTSVGAVPEFARDGANAIVVDARDVEEMAQGVERVLLDAEIRNTLARNGLETAERYSLDRVALLFCDALRRIHGRSTGRASRTHASSHVGRADRRAPVRKRSSDD